MANMRLERKVRIQQNTIEKQRQEILSLEEENKQLKDRLLIEKNKPHEGYAYVKQLIDDLTISKAEYKKLIEDCKKIKRKYEENLQELFIIKKYFKKIRRKSL